MREAPTRLRCERMDNPLGLEESSPRLSWWVNDPRPAEMQTAYHIQAARTLESLQRGDATLWDSGRVGSARSTDVVWGGGALRSRERVWWRVRSFDSDGLGSPWSEPACFEMGLLLSTDWRGRWISTPLCGSPVTPAPVPRLWHDFELSEAPAWARLYVAVLGEAVIQVNGSPPGEHEPIAPWSDYQRRVPYAVHDVGRLLRAGPNRIAVLLADGQFSGALAGGRRQRYGQRPAVCVQLEYGAVGTAPGSAPVREAVVSDLAWQWRPSWLLRAERDDGEEADGRQWLADWGVWSADDQGFPVQEAAFAPLRRYRPAWPGARVLAEHTPVQRTLTGADADAATVRAVVDFGRELLGRVRVRLRARPGVAVTVRYLDEAGAACVDRYTARGHGTEWFEPQFSLHLFRRVEVLADAADADIETVLAREIGIDGVPAGSFDCDHAPLLARYDHAARLARMTLALGPVADPHVGGRRARSADLQAILGGASGCLDVGSFFAGWLGGIAELQQQRGHLPATQPDFGEPHADGAGLGAWLASLWQLYRRTGDRRVLERSLPLVRRQLEEMPALSPAAAGSTRAELLESLWFVFRCMVAARVAGVLGRQRDLGEFHRHYVEARQAFRERFVTRAGLLAADDQLAYLLAIVTAVVEGDARGAAVEHIAEQLRHDELRPRVADRYLSLLLEVLTLEGRPALAYGLACGLPLAGGLAATCIADWLQRFVLGLELDEDLSPDVNAYRRARVQPHPPPDGALAGGTLQRVRGHLDTEHGRYRCAWEVAGGEFRLQLLVPANCIARVLMPDHTAHQVAGGEHELRCAWPEPAPQSVSTEGAAAHYAEVG